VLLFGCSNLLGIPDDPFLLPPDAAAPDPGSSTAGAGNLGEGATPPLSSSDAGGINASSEPVLGGAADDGIIISAPSEDAIRPPNAEVVFTGGAAPAPDCPPLIQPLISDFTVAPGDTSSEASFGPDAAFQGGTYFYPEGGAVTSNLTGGDWHLSGTVVALSGFGLYSSACQAIDASAFPGIAFTLWGNIEGDRALIFFIESAAQQVSSLWTNANKTNPQDPDAPANSGRCIPANARSDGTCREPRVMIQVTSEPTVVEIPWANFAGGSPVPNVNASEITAIAWALPQPGTTPYAFDVHIDDLHFIAP
jgi:hypothetical protein